MRGNIRSSTISAGDFSPRFFQPLRAIVGGEDGEAACLMQLESKQIDHVGFVFHNQDFFVRRNSHRAVKNRL